MGEVEVLGELHAEAPSSINVALNKPTLVSSTYGNNDVYSSPHAVDGDTSSSNLFVSDFLMNNWLRVELEDFYTIHRIVIHNRQDCCQDRLRGYQIEIYNAGTPIFTFNPDDADENPGLVVYVYMPEGGVVGDEVKLSLPGRKDYMNIREIEVYGEFFDSSMSLTNVALNKPSTSSSVHSSFPIENAVDGDMTTMFHSLHGYNWFMVYLESMFNIKRINIHNRIDCCQNRLRGYQIDILNESDEIVYTYNDEYPDESPGELIIVDIPDGVDGIKVKLSVPNRSDYMNILEVEVLA